MDQFKVIISDCHLSAGRFFEGKLNPHEDFHFDDEMVAMFRYFSSGQYGGNASVELIINGDFFDFLNVPYQGEFEDVVTEEMAVEKVKAIIAGHPKVMAEIKRFASQSGKKVTYLVGNHDADLFFSGVREEITRTWDPEAKFPSEKVHVIADRDRLVYDGGVEVRHGNQFEASNELNFEQPVLTDYLDKPVLNVPWGSVYILKIINRMKWERPFIDKVRPVKVFVLFGLILDPWFTIRFCFLSLFYFVKTRFIWTPTHKSKLKQTLDILKQEAVLFLDLEKEARQILDERNDLQTVIFGHTHRPMNKVYPDGKQYINTGTWTKMINLDWARIGQQFSLTFAYIHIKDGRSECDLRQWVGEHSPHKVFSG